MFDERTGQVFEERIALIQSQNDARNWPKKTPIALCQKYRSSETSAYRNYCKVVEQNRSGGEIVAKGPRKLFDISIKVLVSNLHSLPPNTLKHIPLHLLEEAARVAQGRFAELGPLGSFPDGFLDLLPLSTVEGMWAAINQRAQLNLDTWKKISKRLLSEKRDTVTELGLRRYRQEIESPSPELSFYAGPVTSTSFDFLTSLTITAWYPIHDLVNLADVVNLGILQIYETEKSILELGLERLVPDRLLRAWAELAVENGAFSVLRVLKFHVLEGGLTDSSLRHFNSFPALGLVYPGPQGMSESVAVKAKEQGWQALCDSKTYLIGTQFSNTINVVNPRDDNYSYDYWGKQVWHMPFMNFGANNPTSWDGCEVTTLPSKNEGEFLAALEATRLPTHWLSGVKQGGPQNRMGRVYKYDDFVQGESWQKTDWDLFSESLGLPMSNIVTDGDVHCLDQFHGLTYLRLDRDLRAAGVKECGPGIVSIGDTFKSIISTIPIVSILLGPRKLGERFDNLSRTKTWHFLRTHIPDKVPNPDQPTSNPADARSSTAPPSSNKRPGFGSIKKRRPAKVQRFKDFFGAL
ncbi:hypothetical protein VC83_04731 [Pseudogymnoascus destructans]|uniref:Uncharacterized protein n=2 Tax=Pseudogymnoascus destructans TaxID=655981 RepID=L8FTC1_PSED2|nr:uncharacterized protein VC83_04731 [Pseudogymnoascus destructans]ELR03814.1 hypothetical protein GMDG_01343 [Pseudogymnoascus destructans 20631-21]OAF57347.1 hypothetical protein VC83_04731 [Pseudogymnoascus destructans]